MTAELTGEERWTVATSILRLVNSLPEDMNEEAAYWTLGATLSVEFNRLLDRRLKRERERIAKRCQEWAMDRFGEHGPHDARGAALWDVAAWLREEDGK